MSKYIDADKLIAEIKGLQCEQGFDTGEAEGAYQFAIKDILAFINSLQQEQPEVDLVMEYDEQFDSDPVFGKLANRNAGIAIARHFYELGRKERSAISPELDAEIEVQIGSLSKLGNYMEELANDKDSEGAFPLPDNVLNELREFACHFYELGLNARKEK